jgi:very-short-patch-repair endonuclease
LNPLLRMDGFILAEGEPISGQRTFAVVPDRRGVGGTGKNLIFGSINKPDLYIMDAINNDLGMVSNPNNPLWYDRQLPVGALTWGDLVDWWAHLHSLDASSRDAEESLYRRLVSCVGVNSPPEKALFKSYYALLKTTGRSLPALLPQVWLHYDPKSMKARANASERTIARSRMDFLLLLPHKVRVVIEVDGNQHYTDDQGRGSPQAYAAMMEEDRRLRLLGYEVYRFGGAELGEGADAMVQEFFQQLLALHAE